MLYKLVCCTSAAKVAAEVAADRVLPEGYWVLGAVDKLGVLALSKEVVLGINLRAIECLIRCVFIYSKLARLWDAAGAARYWFCC